MSELNDTYKTILNPSQGTYKDKGSKFLAYAYPVTTEEEVREYIQGLKKEYFDARHHCYAFRIGGEGELYRAGDDGEPSGSAGRPILGQLLSNELTNVLVVVVRYFGGIKLGVPGLIAAYKGATLDAIQQAEVVERTVDETFHISFTYSVMNDVMRIVKEEQPEIRSQQLDLSCQMILQIRRSKAERLEARLQKVEGLSLEKLDQNSTNVAANTDY